MACMQDSGLQQCGEIGSQDGTLSSCQELSLIQSAHLFQHGIAQHGTQPLSIQGITLSSSPAVQPDSHLPAEQADIQCKESCSGAGCTIIPVKAPSSGSTASPCKIGSELSGRRARQKKSDLCSADVEEQARAASQSRAHLEWAQRTGYCAVLTLGIIIGAFIFASVCAYHWSILHETPLTLQKASLGDPTGDELLSWEEMALRHGNEAVIILSDSNHREPILTARSDTGPPASSGATLNAHPAGPAVAGTAVNAAPSAAEVTARSGFLGRMTQHRSKHAKVQNSSEGVP